MARLADLTDGAFVDLMLGAFVDLMLGAFVDLMLGTFALLANSCRSSKLSSCCCCCCCCLEGWVFVGTNHVHLNAFHDEFISLPHHCLLGLRRQGNHPVEEEETH
jgi:hypothetical protein